MLTVLNHLRTRRGLASNDAPWRSGGRGATWPAFWHHLRTRTSGQFTRLVGWYGLAASTFLVMVAVFAGGALDETFLMTMVPLFLFVPEAVLSVVRGGTLMANGINAPRPLPMPTLPLPRGLRALAEASAAMAWPVVGLVAVAGILAAADELDALSGRTGLAFMTFLAAYWTAAYLPRGSTARIWIAMVVPWTLAMAIIVLLVRDLPWFAAALAPLFLAIAQAPWPRWLERSSHKSVHRGPLARRPAAPLDTLRMDLWRGLVGLPAQPQLLLQAALMAAAVAWVPGLKDMIPFYAMMFAIGIGVTGALGLPVSTWGSHDQSRGQQAGGFAQATSTWPAPRHRLARAVLVHQALWTVLVLAAAFGVASLFQQWGEAETGHTLTRVALGAALASPMLFAIGLELRFGRQWVYLLYIMLGMGTLGGTTATSMLRGDIAVLPLGILAAISVLIGLTGMRHLLGRSPSRAPAST